MKKRTICPKCGEHLVPFIGFRGGLIYQCNNCGYRGPLAFNVESKNKTKKRI